MISRHSVAHIILLVLALVGAGVSIYLTAVHYQGAPLACANMGLVNCERVLSSMYSVVPGTSIPISIPGLLWCLVAAVLAGMILRQPDQRTPRLALFAWTVLGMLTVLYLVYVEIVRIDAICIWCTSLHIIIFVMFLLSVTQLQAPVYEEEEIEEEETAVKTARR